MEKEFVSYELSLALKEIGYQSPNPIGGYRGGAIFYYERSSELFYDGLPMYSSSYHEGQIIAPLYQQAFRWFRDEYNLVFNFISYSIVKPGEYHWSITWHDVAKASGIVKTYEEAELACLNKLIEIVKNKQD